MDNNDIDIDNMDSSKVIILFNEIITASKNRNTLSRGARTLSIDNESYDRVTNNLDNYSEIVQSGSGFSKWFYFNSSSEGIGFIIKSNNSWSWQKQSDDNIITIY